jgi:hypothetical protein
MLSAESPAPCPFCTQPSFLHLFVTLCCNSSSSPNGNAHFPDLSEGSTVHNTLFVKKWLGALRDSRNMDPEMPGSWHTWLQHLAQCLRMDWRCPFTPILEAPWRASKGSWYAPCIVQSLPKGMFSRNIQYMYNLHLAPGSQLGVILLPMEHLTISGDIFACHNWTWRCEWHQVDQGH